MERLPNGYYVAHGRSDDTMNLGGIKVSLILFRQDTMLSCFAAQYRLACCKSKEHIKPS